MKYAWGTLAISMTHLTSMYLDLSVEKTKDLWTFATRTTGKRNEAWTENRICISQNQCAWNDNHGSNDKGLYPFIIVGFSTFQSVRPDNQLNFVRRFLICSNPDNMSLRSDDFKSKVILITFTGKRLIFSRRAYPHCCSLLTEFKRANVSRLWYLSSGNPNEAHHCHSDARKEKTWKIKWGQSLKISQAHTIIRTRTKCSRLDCEVYLK